MVKLQQLIKCEHCKGEGSIQQNKEKSEKNKYEIHHYTKQIDGVNGYFIAYRTFLRYPCGVEKREVDYIGYDPLEHFGAFHTTEGIIEYLGFKKQDGNHN